MITQARLKELFSYNEFTGEFTRIKRTHRRDVGSKVGAIHPRGYQIIGIDGKRYKAHHLAWLYVYGELPKLSIDHINRETGDNRIANLRLATQKQNNENISMRKDNTSGYRGVTWHSAGKKWRAQVSHNKKYIIVGMFDNKEDAAKAVEAKRLEIFTHYQPA
jgi:citrate synthase